MTHGAFDALTAAYRDRLAFARRHAAGGGCVVGLIGDAVPVELVEAAGALPVRLSAQAGRALSRADAWMEPEHDFETRSLFDALLAGDFDFCAAIVVATTSDATRFLFHYTKEVARQGHCDRLPPLLPYDPMFGALPAIHRYGLDRLHELASRLAAITGDDPAASRIAATIAASRRRRALLERLDVERCAGRVAGTQAFRAIGARFFMAGEDYEQLLETALSEVVIRPETRKPRALIVPAVPLFHDRLHEVIEDAGAQVIAEDDAWGTRGHAALIGDGPPLSAVFDAYWSETASPRAPAAKREAWLRRRLDRGGIDAAIVYVPPTDHDFGWSIPGLGAVLQAHGVPWLLLRDDILDSDGMAAIARQAVSFVAQRGAA